MCDLRRVEQRGLHDDPVGADPQRTPGHLAGDVPDDDHRDRDADRHPRKRRGGRHPAIELRVPQHVVQQQPAIGVRRQRVRRSGLGFHLHAGQPETDAGARGQHRVGPFDRAGQPIRGGQRAALFVGQDDHPDPQRGRPDALPGDRGVRGLPRPGHPAGHVQGGGADGPGHRPGRASEGTGRVTARGAQDHSGGHGIGVR